METFPIGLKMILSEKWKSALRCKSSTRLATLEFSALTQHWDLQALCEDGSFQPPHPTNTVPQHHWCQSFQKKIKWGLKTWLKIHKEGSTTDSKAKQRFPWFYAFRKRTSPFEGSGLAAIESNWVSQGKRKHQFNDAVLFSPTRSVLPNDTHRKGWLSCSIHQNMTLKTCILNCLINHTHTGPVQLPAYCALKITCSQKMKRAPKYIPQDLFSTEGWWVQRPPKGQDSRGSLKFEMPHLEETYPITGDALCTLIF